MSLALCSMVSSLSVYVCTVKELQVSASYILLKDCSITHICIIRFPLLCVLAVLCMVFLLLCVVWYGFWTLLKIAKLGLTGNMNVANVDVPSLKVIISLRWSLFQQAALHNMSSHDSGGFCEINTHKCMRFLVSLMYFSSSWCSLFMPGMSCVTAWSTHMV